jgi:hypothetical protein
MSKILSTMGKESRTKIEGYWGVAMGRRGSRWSKRLANKQRRRALKKDKWA